MAQAPLPSKLPQWADSGAVIVEPSTPYKQAGWGAVKPPFAYFNWWMNLVYQWFQYANAKLNFTPGTLADEVLTVTANIVVPTQANSVCGAVTATLGYATFTNFTTGGMWVLHGNSTNAVTVKHQMTAVPAAFILAGAQDVVLLAKNDFVMFQLNADGYWYEVCRSISLPHAGFQSVAGGAYAISAFDETILVDTTSGASTMTLPSAAVNKGRVFRIKKINSGASTVTISTTSAQTVDGLTSVVLSAQYSTLEVISDGANWSMLMPGYAPAQTVVDGGASASSATVYTATPTPAMPAYYTGMAINFQAVLANTGAATLNVSALGAKNLKVFINGAKADPTANVIGAGARVVAVYDGTDFIIVAGLPLTGQRLAAISRPSAVASVAITGLTAGKRYKAVYELVQNTSAGIFKVRFNNDSGANYKWAGWTVTSAGTTGANGGSGDASIQTTRSTTVVAGEQITGEFVFTANNSDTTKVTVAGQNGYMIAGPELHDTMFSGYYDGAAAVTEIDFLTSAGTFTGQILIFALGD